MLGYHHSEDRTRLDMPHTVKSQTGSMEVNEDTAGVLILDSFSDGLVVQLLFVWLTTTQATISSQC